LICTLVLMNTANPQSKNNSFKIYLFLNKILQKYGIIFHNWIQPNFMNIDVLIYF